VTRENTSKRTEKFVAVSDGAKHSILATLDSRADNYEADTTAYKKHRLSSKGAGERRKK
jgi:hypothetical protein